MTTTNNSAQIQMLSRPDCPAALLEQHLNHQDENIRSAIASSTALNEAQQNQLADDESVAVRLALLSNPVLGASIMARLFEDANLRAALVAALSIARNGANLNTSPEAAPLAETAVSDAHPHQTSSSSIHFSEAQIKLPEEGDEQRRAEFASHPDLSKEMQSKLLQDKEESVLVALASNPSLLEEG